MVVSGDSEYEDPERDLGTGGLRHRGRGEGDEQEG